jgi:hypothetical protein
VEEYNFFQDTNLSSDFTHEELIILNKKLDQTLEQLSRLEFGQQITYDNLKEEINELKELTQAINKKNWFQLLQGKLVSIGLGKISDQVLEVIKDTLGSKRLIE